MTIPHLNRGDTLVLATHNKGKIAEFAALLGGYGIRVISAGDLSLPEPDETADSFAGNAAIKAVAAAKAAARHFLGPLGWPRQGLPRRHAPHP